MDRIEEDITAYLERIVEEERREDHRGAMESSMDNAGESGKDLLGVCAVSTEGTLTKAGDADEIFALESASKPLGLALALEDNGADAVFQHVATEPTGDPYHSVATLEEGERGVPSNPMINAGAIAVTAMIKGKDGDERFQRLLDFTRKLTGNPRVDYNHTMFEAKEKDLNRALFYYMRSHGVVNGSEEEKLVPYIKQTLIEMDGTDLARIAAVLANQGRDPESGEQLISADNVRIVLTLMFTTGMYDASGRFAVDVGIPAKSGLSGVILAVVPGRMGLGILGPALDESGSSIAGVRILRKLTRRWQLGVFS